ncbi:unnamed protein product [Durusdinium trenchii]|uniref:Uncharacterized protein n=1 Tax=Durusdinium trenchii TaxID=1381693 RepID=A0ABP0NSN5_9DINO
MVFSRFLKQIQGLVLAKLKQQWPLAIHLFHDLAHQRLQHDTVSVNAALVAANQERRYSKNFVNEQLTSASAVDSATCSTVAQGGHDSETVLELLQRMKASLQQPDLGAHDSLLYTLQRDGRWEAAQQHVQSMRHEGVEAKSSTWTSLMGSMDRGQQWLQVLKLLDLGIQLDLVLASSAISAVHTGHGWHLAWQSFHQLRPRSLQPDVAAHSAVISAAEKGQQWALALAAAGAGVELDLISLNTAVSACEKGLQWAKVNGLLSAQMPHRGITSDAISFNSAILALTAARRWQSALDLAHAAGERGITPQVGSYGALLMECEEASPSLLSCQEELLRSSLEAAGLVEKGATAAGLGRARRSVRFVELCCPQDDRHHTLRRDFGKFDEKRFSELLGLSKPVSYRLKRFRNFLVAENERNRSRSVWNWESLAATVRSGVHVFGDEGALNLPNFDLTQGGGSRQTDFFRLAGRAEMGSASDDLWPYLGFETPRTPLNSAALNPPEPGRRVLGISPKGQMLGLGFWKVYRQLKAVSAFPIQENLSAAILAASEAQAALKQPNLSDRDMADGLREQELLEAPDGWMGVGKGFAVEKLYVAHDMPAGGSVPAFGIFSSSGVHFLFGFLQPEVRVQEQAAEEPT